jgi:hypothetical protein
VTGVQTCALPIYSTNTTKATVQGGSSKFIAKANTKSTGAAKKPIKTGGSRGS